MLVRKKSVEEFLIYERSSDDEKENDDEEENEENNQVELCNGNGFNEIPSLPRCPSSNCHNDNCLTVEAIDERDEHFNKISKIKIGGKNTSPSTSKRSKPNLTNLPTTSNNLSIRIDNTVDWFGNTCLHQLFASHDVEITFIERAVKDFPENLSCQNQFGRIPLHYAVDRSKINQKGFEVLLHYYPQGVCVQDNEGKTPYDIAMKWEHPRSVLLALLNCYPDVDKAMYMKLKYGPIGSLAHWASSSFRSTPVSGEEPAVFDETPNSGSNSSSNALIENTVFSTTLSRSQSIKFNPDSVRRFSIGNSSTNI